MAQELIIRAASPADAAALRDIYAPYVERTAITFEYDVPPEAAFRARMERILARYPWLVAQRGGEALGYAYLSAFVGRAAYDHGAETSIYLRQDSRGTGLGGKLYAALEAAARAQNIYALYACIAAPQRDDAYLTANSLQFHAHMGYKAVGRFAECGYKFGRWYDMVWMEKQLAARPDAPPPLLPFPQLGADTLAACGILPAEAR